MKTSNAIGFALAAAVLTALQVGVASIILSGRGPALDAASGHLDRALEPASPAVIATLDPVVVIAKN